MLCTCCTVSSGKLAPFRSTAWKAQTIPPDTDSTILCFSPSPSAHSSLVLQKGRLENPQGHLLTASLLCCKHRHFEAEFSAGSMSWVLFHFCQDRRKNRREVILDFLSHQGAPWGDNDWPWELLPSHNGRERVSVHHCCFPFIESVSVLAISKYYFPL